MKYFIYIFLLIIIIVFFAYRNSLSLNNIEQFTPKIREFYRPILRNTRIIGEGFYNKSSSQISNLFRKFGII
jgi:hypothetical protein